MIKKVIFRLLSEMKGNSFFDQYNKIKNMERKEKSWKADFKRILLHAYKNCHSIHKDLRKSTEK
jgi:hypothetical protein